MRSVTLCSLLLVWLSTGCAEDDGVGYLCALEEPAQGSELVIERPSVDCRSRICLQLEASQPALCTAACRVVGDPCTPSVAEHCPGEFRCRVPFEVGHFADQPLCVCQRYFEGIHQ